MKLKKIIGLGLKHFKLIFISFIISCGKLFEKVNISSIFSYSRILVNNFSKSIKITIFLEHLLWATHCANCILLYSLHLLLKFSFYS